jgi:hypothetical protein
MSDLCPDLLDHLRPMGHWHEILNGETVHCYEISDSLITVDKFTFGYTRDVTDNDIYQPIVTNSSFELLKDYKTNNNQVTIGDSILWINVKNDTETFNSDLAVGLLLRVLPPEIDESEYELPYDTLATRIYIGQLKDQLHDRLLANQYYIQLNDVIASFNDLDDFFTSYHGGNEKRIAVVHADRKTPKGLLKGVMEKIVSTGYLNSNIYRTVIDSNKKTMGLVRCR